MNYESVRFYNEKNSIWPHMLTVEHFDNSYEIIIVREGIVRYSVLGKIYKVTSNQMMFINSNVLHHRVSMGQIFNQEETAKFDVIIINPEAVFPGHLAGFYQSISGEDALPFLIFSQGSQRQREIIDMFAAATCKYKEKKKGYELDVLSDIYRASNMLINYISNMPARLGDDKDIPMVMKDMIGYIQENYKKKLTLAMIGEAAGICRSRCCSNFKSYLKESANDYLAYYRLAKSIEISEANDMSFAEIAKECGFNGASYYSELFKKVVHCTPTEYKERITAM